MKPMLIGVAVAVFAVVVAVTLWVFRAQPASAVAALPGEVLVDDRPQSVVFRSHTEEARHAFPGARVRVSDRRVVIGQAAVGGPDRLVAVVGRAPVLEAGPAGRSFGVFRLRGGSVAGERVELSVESVGGAWQGVYAVEIETAGAARYEALLARPRSSAE